MAFTERMKMTSAEGSNDKVATSLRNCCALKHLLLLYNLREFTSEMENVSIQIFGAEQFCKGKP